MISGSRVTLGVALGVWVQTVATAQERRWPALERYQAMAIPADNPMTEPKVALGKQLFFDKRLSGDGSRACISCHQPQHGLTEGGTPLSGAYGSSNDRSCPTLWNVAYQQGLYWEGAGRTIEQAVAGVWRYNMAPGGPGQLKPADVAARLDRIPGYRRQFERVFGREADTETIPKALAAYLRTLVADRSRWIRFYYGDTQALSARARRGYEVFDKKARCTECHNGQLLTDLQYHNVGIGSRGEKPEPGRFVITRQEKDRGAFKTPTLLNVAKSAPYFHDGSVEKLAEAVDVMLGGGIANPHKDAALQPVSIFSDDRAALLQFFSELNVDYDEAEPVLPEDMKETNMSGSDLRSISQIAIVVHDVAKAEAFYGTTLGLKHLFSVPARLAFFDIGGTRLMLSLPEPTVSHKSGILYFDVADILATHKSLVAKGVKFVGEPHAVGMFEGNEIWIVEFSDPDGNLLALQSAVKK